MSRWAWGLLVATVVAVLVPVGPASADSYREQEWQLPFLNATEAHRYSEGDGVVVAVLDSGVDATHPDLTGNVVAGIDVQPGATGDGRVDTDGHGTAMAGLIAAHGHGSNNADGALGIAPRATILPVKDGDGQTSAIPAAIDWAVAHGAKIISISQAGDAGDPGEQRAIDAALAHDVVVVAGVGNAPGVSVQYPAAYPGVVAVAGVDQQGNHADFSLTGPQVALSAPAVKVAHPWLQHGYARSNGTSDATAIVAGVAALVRAKFPNLSATEVVHRLTATAIDKGPPGRDPFYGYGIVNPVGALTADVPPLPRSPSPSPAPSGAGGQPKPTTTSPWVYVGIGAVILLVVLAAFGAARRRRAS